MIEAGDRYTKNAPLSLIRYSDGFIQADLTGEYVLPDYLPDIRKIISSDAKIKHSERFADHETLKSSGEVTYTVLYIGEEDQVRSVVFSDSYSETMNVQGLQSDDILISDSYLDGISCRAVNPRKLSLRARAVDHVRVYRPMSLMPRYEGSETDIAGVETREETTESFAVGFFSEQDIGGSVDVETEKPVKELIFCDLSFLSAEGRCLAGHADLHMECQLQYLYESDGGELLSGFHKFNVEHSLETDFPDDFDKTVSVRPMVGHVQCTVNANGNGENRIMETDFTYAVSLVGCKTVSVPYVRDLYAVDCVEKTEMNTVSVCRIGAMQTGSFSVNLSKKKSECDAEDAASILDCFCSIKHGSSHFDRDKQKTVIETTAEIGMLLKTGDGTCRAVTLTEPIVYEADSKISDSADCLYELYPATVRGRSDETNLYADLEIGFRVMIIGVSELQTVSRCSFDHTQEESPRHAMILYYPQTGDTLWSVARRYRVPIEKIRDANPGITSAVSDPIPLQSVPVLMIPDKGRKASFSAVI